MTIRKDADQLERRNETKRIVQGIADFVNQTLRPSVNDPFLRYQPSRVVRDADGVITSGEWSEEFFEKPSMAMSVLLLGQYFKNTPEFAQKLSTIASMYGKPTTSIQNAIESFLLSSLIRQEPNIEALLDDLDEKACTWNVKAYLIGVVPESEISLSEGIALRGLVEADLSYEAPAGARLLSKPELWPFSDSVLTMKMVSRYPGPVQRRVNTFCVLLSLYRESPAYWETCSMRPVSYSQFGGTIRGGLIARQPRVLIRQHESGSLAQFVRNYEARIPKAVLEGTPIDPLEVSMKRYLDSIRGNLPVEERLTYAVMGLEALLLENETELRFRLSLRTAQVLRYLNEDPSAVYSAVHEAYGYRSSHVHGSVLSDAKKLRAQEVLNVIWRLLRKILLYVMTEGIASQEKKRTFLSEIDRALVDDKVRRNLEGKIDVAKGSMTGAI